MRLLFDQNLSPRLVDSLAQLYPGSVHVGEVGLKEATDTVIWEYAKTHGFVIVSKDSDFQQRSLLFGHPPKFVWLRAGNCSVQSIEELLRKHARFVHAFGQSPRESHLMLP